MNWSSFIFMLAAIFWAIAGVGALLIRDHALVRDCIQLMLLCHLIHLHFETYGEL